MGVFLNNIPNGINKSLRFAWTLMKKSHKSFSADKNVSLVFYFTLVLLLAKQSGIFQESGSKQNPIWACSIGGGKVIFALLEKNVTLQMGFTLINVWEPSFQRLLR